VISQGSTTERLHSNTPKECDSPKVKQEPGTSAPQGIAQQQSLQQMKNLQLQGSNQTNTSTTMAKPPVVTFHMLILLLGRRLDKDRDIQVQSIFAKLRVGIYYFLH
jgi:transcription initiation factor TFIID subunit 4